MKESKMETQDGGGGYTIGDLSTFQSVIAIAGCNVESNKSKSETLYLALPRMVHIIFEKWDTISIPHFNTVCFQNLYTFLVQFRILWYILIAIF